MDKLAVVKEDNVVDTMNKYKSADVVAFVLGYKPAVLITARYHKKAAAFLGEIENAETPAFKRLKDAGYPYIEFPDRHSALFFQGKDAKKWFEHNGLVKYEFDGKNITDYRHDTLGYSLGFPPGAVQMWNRLTRFDKPKFQRERIGVSYHGISFMSNINTLYEDITWLWEVRPVPTVLKGATNISDCRGKGRKEYRVNDYDYDGLRKLVDDLILLAITEEDKK
ncbi:hypothetical protein [Bacillus phage Nachito]|nr:hypothetical protein [Bacillus phage Nachito]